jgi:hypothetical protein
MYVTCALERLYHSIYIAPADTIDSRNVTLTKLAVSSAGLRPKSDCSGKVQNQLYSKLQTRPLIRGGATK